MTTSLPSWQFTIVMGLVTFPWHAWGQGPQPPEPSARAQLRQADSTVPAPIEMRAPQKEPAKRQDTVTKSRLASGVRLVSADAIAGAPLGAGRIELHVANAATLHWHEDQFIQVDCLDDRVLYEVTYRERIKDSPEQDTAWILVVYFLFQGDDELDLKIRLGKKVLGQSVHLRVHNDRSKHQQRLGDWWSRYVADSMVETAPELKQLRRQFLEILGRRLDLPLPSRSQVSSSETDLETQFERSVSMLFGFESVRLAMMNDVEAVGKQQSDATYRLPRAARFSRQPVPAVFPVSNIEGLALATPEKCFYLRCGRVKNYLWVRQLVMGWGGSLNEIVSNPTLEYDVRTRIETQLAISPDDAFAKAIDEEITDFALIGYDTNFHDGAGLGVLFEATENSELTDLLRMHRRHAQKLTDAESSQVELEGQDVEFLSTDDHKVRSYYVVRGKYHLVTNSRRMASEFLQVGSSVMPLGHAKDFQYTHSQLADRGEHQAFLFMSDAFFRNNISPHYRVERHRRQLAKSDLQSLYLASLAAKAERLPADSIDEFVRSKFLPYEFGRRADQSHPVAQGDEFVDSLRGAMGTFLPIADVAIDQVTAGEISMYQGFVSKYQQQWQRVDPVGMTFSRAPSPNDGQVERVVLDVKISPYAQQEYRFLTQYLAATQRRRVAMGDHEVMGLSARIQGAGPVDVHVGLVDTKVEYRVRNGKLERLGDFERRDFATRQAYAAVTPQGNDNLRRLQAFITSLQTRGAVADQIASQTKPPAKKDSKADDTLRWLARIAFAMPMSPVPETIRSLHDVKGLGLLSLSDVAKLTKLSKLRTIESGENVWGTWSLVSENAELRQRIDEMRFENAPRAAQVFLKVRDINTMQVMDYLKAHCFVKARRASAFHTTLLNQVAARSNLSPHTVREAIENALNAKMVCPLGGEYALRPESPQWVSSAWDTDALLDVNAVPKDYQFKFFHWLRGLTIEFSLSQSTLHSRMALNIYQPNRLADLHDMRVTRPEQVAIDPPKAGSANSQGAKVRRTETRRPEIRRPESRGGASRQQTFALLKPRQPNPRREAAIRITNRTNEPRYYEVRREDSKQWSRPHELKPGRSHVFQVNYSIRVRYSQSDVLREHTIAPRSHREFRELTRFTQE